MTVSSPRYIAVLTAAKPGDVVRTFGPFIETTERSAWRSARTFVEDNLALSGGSPERWVVSQLDAPPAEYDQPTALVVVQGGCVQDVHAPEGVDVRTLDWDQVDDECRHLRETVSQQDGKPISADAVLSTVLSAVGPASAAWSSDAARLAWRDAANQVAHAAGWASYRSAAEASVPA